MTSHDMRAYGLGTAAPAGVTLDLPRVRERRGVLFLALRPSNRLAVATTIARLIDMLGAADADPDLEPMLGGYSGPGDDREGADDERLFSSGFGMAGCEDDEDSDPAGGDIVDEPHDDELRGRLAVDCEPLLGWPEGVDQETRNTLADCHWHDDGEEDAGDIPEGDLELEESADDFVSAVSFAWPDDDPGVPQDGPAFHAAARPLAEQAVRS